MKIGQDIICVNDKFQPEQIVLIPNRPVQDKMYTIRDVFSTRNGRALHLDQITNPHLEHPSGLGTFEPSFSVDRFATLIDDEAIVEEEVIEEVYLS